MTDTPPCDEASAVQARLDALRRRRNPTRPAASGHPATPRRPPGGRQHPAHGSRVGAAALGVAVTLGLVGAMALARPDTSASSPPTARRADPTLLTPTVPGTRSAAGTVTGAPTPPLPLTVTPTVRATAPTTAAPTARTHGSH